MNDISQFMKNELVKYIKSEMSKGHSLSTIKHALLRGGHHTDLVNETIQILIKHNFDLKPARTEKHGQRKIL